MAGGEMSPSLDLIILLICIFCCFSVFIKMHRVLLNVVNLICRRWHCQLRSVEHSAVILSASILQRVSAPS